MAEVTEEEQEVLELIIKGYNWLEISREKNLRESQIYTLKKRLAKKLAYLQVDKMNDIQHIGGIIMIATIGRLKKLAKQIETMWEHDNLTKCYKKPGTKTIQEFVEDALMYVTEGKIVYRDTGRKPKIPRARLDSQLKLFDFYDI